MYIHNLNPILFEIGGYGLRWYSLAYIFGILIGWLVPRPKFIGRAEIAIWSPIKKRLPKSVQNWFG